MAFAAGTRFGVYEITSLIGVGGMGEVYSARDAQLQRDVALKARVRARATGSRSAIRSS
jgi:serine/threonine protein kinase